MDKLTISKEEEKLIGEYREVVPEAHRWIEQFRKYQKDPFKSAQFMPLLDFTPQQFALLLCGWYEVEQPYKEGEWVIWNDRVRITKITHIEHEKGRFLSDTYDCWEPVRKIERHATPEEIAQEKERRFWSELDRHIEQFKSCDIIRDIEGELREVESYINDEILRTTDGWHVDIKDAALVCPVERRLDT